MNSETNKSEAVEAVFLPEVIEINPQKFDIEPAAAVGLIGNLPDIRTARKQLEDQFHEISVMDIDDPETSKIARTLRLKIKDNRTKEIMVWHKNAKEVFLRGGMYIDALKNQEIAVNERMEEHLQRVEKHAENVEKARVQTLHEERISQVQQYIGDTSNLQLGALDDDMWDAYYTARKNSYEKREAERIKKEEDRIAAEKEEKEKQELQRLEVERLKKEAEDREAELQAEKEERAVRVEILRPYIQFIRDYEELITKSEEDFQAEVILIDQGAKEHFAYEAEQESIKLAEQKKKDDEIEADRKKRLAEINAERAEKTRLAAELKTREEADEKAARAAEKKAEEERLAKEEKEEKARIAAENKAKAPIKNQLSLWVDEFAIEIPSAEILNNEKALLIRKKFDAFKKWAQEQIESI